MSEEHKVQTVPFDNSMTRQEMLDHLRDFHGFKIGMTIPYEDGESGYRGYTQPDTTKAHRQGTTQCIDSEQS